MLAKNVKSTSCINSLILKLIHTFRKNHSLSNFLHAKSITDKTLEQFIKYLVTGFTTFTIEYILYRILISFMNLYIGNAIVFAFIFWLNFLLNRIWSFNSKSDFKKQLLSYGILFCINLVIANILLLYILTDVVGIHQHYSKILMMGAVVSWNFVLYKKIIYK